MYENILMLLTFQTVHQKRNNEDYLVGIRYLAELFPGIAPKDSLKVPY